MPDYRLLDGRIITVKEEDVASFMNSKLGLGSMLIPVEEVVPAKTLGPVDVDPNIGLQENTGSGLENGSSEPVDPYDEYSVTWEDLKDIEENVSPELNAALAAVGLYTEQGTSFKGLDALHMKKIGEGDTSNGDGTYGDGIVGDLLSAISIGKGKSKEELMASAAKINEFIRANGDLDFVSKAQKRSGASYDKYTEGLIAPDIEDKDLRASMKQAKVSKFSQIKKSNEEDIVESGFVGSKVVGSKQVSKATLADFDNEKEFEDYKAWKEEGYIRDFSKDEVAKYNSDRKSEFASNASINYASYDANINERTDILALAGNDKKRLNNYIGEVQDLEKIGTDFSAALDSYKFNPTPESRANAVNINIAYLKRKGEVQSLESRLKDDGSFKRSSAVPLALLDFNKDYSRLAQLQTGFKNVGASIAYGAATLAVLANSGQNTTALASNPALLNQLIEDTTGLVSLGKSLEAESNNFQRAIAIHEITSLKDAGRWVAGSTVNLIPSLSMAFTGPAAMPLFFLSGGGGKGMEMAISQKDAADRMTKNKKFLIDNPDASPFDLININKEMAEDSKTLNIKGWQSLGIQALYGIGEVASEKLGTMLLLKNIKNGIKMLPPTTIKEGFAFAGKQLSEGVVTEGGSEFANTVFQNLGDITILGEDKNMFEGGLESFAQGALMGGAMNSVNLSKGLKQGYVSVLASKAESKELKVLLARLRKVTGKSDLDSWEGAVDKEVPAETDSIANEIIGEMQALEQGVMFKLGTTLSIEQAKEVEEKNRKMRLINKRLITASNNPNIKAAQLKNIEAELRVQFDKLAEDREGLLSNKEGAKNTKEAYVATNVSLNSSEGYAYYQRSMLHESVTNILSNYLNLSPEANQAGLDAAKAELVAAGQVDPSVDSIKEKARKTYVDGVYKDKIIKGRKFALDFAAQNGLKLEEQTFEGKTDKEANEAYLQAMLDIPGFDVDEVSGKDSEGNDITIRDRILDGQVEGQEIGGTIYINMNVSVKNRRIGIYAHEVLHVYAKQHYGDNKDTIDNAGKDLLDYLEKNDPDLHAKVEFRINQSYTQEIEGGKTVKKKDYYEEAMNAMSDVLADGQQLSEPAAKKVRNFANAFLAGLGSKFQFKAGQEAESYEFVKGYNKAAHFGGKNNIVKRVVKSSGEPEDKDVKKSTGKTGGSLSLTARQDLKWKNTDGDLSATFKVGERTFTTSLVETAFMEFDEGQTYKDIEEIAQELDIAEDKDGDEIESSERYFHYEFGDIELGKDITGTGNAMEVFSVAINGVAEYLNKKKKTEGVIFTAKEASRIRLYKTLGQALADKIGGSFAYRNDTFIVSKKPPVKAKFSQSTPLEAINALVPSTIKTQAEYFSPKVFNPIYNALEDNGVISNYIKSKSPSKEVASKTIESIRERLINFDPEATRKDKDNAEPITFGEFIFANTNFGKLDAKKALFKESEAEKKTTDLDNKEAQNKVASESSAETKSKKKYTPLTANSKLAPSFLINEIKSKLSSIISKVTSKYTARPKGKNAQTTPFVAEVKKAVGNVVKDPKALPKQVIDRMGNPKDGSYQTFLKDSKKSILENLTTTSLTGLIPQAVEKSVGGKYEVDDKGKKVKDRNGNDIFKPNFVPYSEWKGQKIDREKVSTNQKGSTSGNEIIRRAIRVENTEGSFVDSITDADFIANFIGKDGKVVRGKREALGKALAEEISFEVLNKELANKNSEIRKAFKNNQSGLNEVLLDNFVEQISRDIERGSAKYSATLGAKTYQIKNEFISGLKSDRFNALFVSIWEEGSENPFYDTALEYFEEFPVEGITEKEIKQIAKDFASEYVFDKKEVGITRVVIKEGVEATLDYLISQGVGRTERGTNWGSVQKMLEGLVSKLDLKKVGDLNLGRRALKKLARELDKRGYTGNQIYTMLSYSYGPSGIGGFKGALIEGGKKRITPKGVTLTKAELGDVNFNSKGGVENRGALVLNTADFIQNILPKNAKKDGKPTGEVVSIPTNVSKKNYYTKEDSPFNKKPDAEKKKEARALWKLGETYGKDLVEIIKAIESLDIPSASRRELVTGNFASMKAAGKIPSTVRFYPARMDGALLTFDELVKLFGREDGEVDTGVFEHTKPANRIAIASYIYSITGLKKDLDILEKELLDYDTAMITYGMDTSLRELKLQSSMGLNYKVGEGVMGTRYSELITRMGDAGVTFWDAKTGKVISQKRSIRLQVIISHYHLRRLECLILMIH